MGDGGAEGTSSKRSAVYELIEGEVWRSDGYLTFTLVG